MFVGKHTSLQRLICLLFDLNSANKYTNYLTLSLLKIDHQPWRDMIDHSASVFIITQFFLTFPVNNGMGQYLNKRITNRFRA